LADETRVATFLGRPNRFVGEIEIDGKPALAHINSSGRMQELLVAGRDCVVVPSRNQKRRCRYDLKSVRVGGAWCNIDSMLPNRLVSYWLQNRMLPELGEYDEVRREVQVGESRLDFQLTAPDGDTYIEVKSVTLAVADWGIFPDAPSTRAVKHCRELTRLARAGHRTAIVFVMPHPRMLHCWANGITDPDFEAAVIAAREAGTKILSYQVRITRNRAYLLGGRPVEPPSQQALRALNRHIRRYASRPVVFSSNQSPKD
jgi:sugar fermentation stimulation protein A